MNYLDLLHDLYNGHVLDCQGQLFKMTKDQTVTIDKYAVGFRNQNSKDYVVGKISEVMTSPFIKIEGKEVDVRTVIVLKHVTPITIEMYLYTQ